MNERVWLFQKILVLSKQPTFQIKSSECRSSFIIDYKAEKFNIIDIEYIICICYYLLSLMLIYVITFSRTSADIERIFRDFKRREKDEAYSNRKWNQSIVRKIHFKYAILLKENLTNRESSRYSYFQFFIREIAFKEFWWIYYPL